MSGGPISERIRARQHDAPIPTEYLLDDAADTIDALVAALEAMREFLDPMRFNRGSDNVRADELDKMALAALALARGEPK